MINRIAVAGGTGLVGREFLNQAAKSKMFKNIIAFTRRQPDESFMNGNIKWLQVDFENIGELDGKTIDQAFCCLGTTMKKAGSRKEFFKVDHDYVLNFAKWARKHGAKRFFLVTAQGSNPHSFSYYYRVKGAIENSVRELGFENLIILRPSLLLGKRDEVRVLEKIGSVLIKFIQPLMIGPLARQKPVYATSVAKTMLDLAPGSMEGDVIVNSVVIRKK